MILYDRRIGAETYPGTNIPMRTGGVSGVTYLGRLGCYFLSPGEGRVFFG